MIQVKHEEQYSLIVPASYAGNPAYEELEKTIIENLGAGRRNFILNLEGIPDVPDDAVPNLSQLQRIIEKEDGRLVVACPPMNLEEGLEENGIVATPTLNEATDYIFMEEIEKQLLDGMDEEE